MWQATIDEVPSTPHIGDIVPEYQQTLNSNHLVPTANWISSSQDDGTPTVPRTPVLLQGQHRTPVLTPQSRVINDQNSTPASMPRHHNTNFPMSLYYHFITPRRLTGNAPALEPADQIVPRTPDYQTLSVTQTPLTPKFLSLASGTSPTVLHHEFRTTAGTTTVSMSSLPFRQPELTMTPTMRQQRCHSRRASIQKQRSLVKMDENSCVNFSETLKENKLCKAQAQESISISLHDKTNTSIGPDADSESDTLSLLRAVAQRLQQNKELTKGTKHRRHGDRHGNETNGFDSKSCDFLDIIEKENVP